MTVKETDIEFSRDELDFLALFFDEILIVFLIVILDKVLSLCGSLRLFLGSVLEGLLHWISGRKIFCFNFDQGKNLLQFSSS